MIFRNGQIVLKEIKGTKKAIGGLSTGLSPDFEEHEIQLQPGDTFYIATDGYADQFGGIRKHKLFTKVFKELLLSISNQSMQAQGEYLNNFIEDWKDGLEQVDDVLVIGVRV